MNMLPAPYVALEMCILITSRDGKPITLRGGIPAGGNYSGTGVINGKFYPDLIPGSMDTARITYIYSSVSGCIDSVRKNIEVTTPPPFTCGNDFSDMRDNKSYQTLQIGAQCWFAKNLNYGQFTTVNQGQRDNCMIEKYCYSDNPINCSTLGGLYQWDEMMQFDDVESAQGFCPPGWHIPSENEWIILFTVYTDIAHSGDELKVGGISGFNAALNGGYFNFQDWSFKDVSTFFWSSTSHGLYKAWAHGINTVNHGVSTYPSLRSNAFSIRCLKD